MTSRGSSSARRRLRGLDVGARPQLDRHQVDGGDQPLLDQAAEVHLRQHHVAVGAEGGADLDEARHLHHAVADLHLERPALRQQLRHVAELGPRAAVEGDGVRALQRVDQRPEAGEVHHPRLGVEADELHGAADAGLRVPPARLRQVDRHRRPHLRQGERLAGAGAREGLRLEARRGERVHQEHVGAHDLRSARWRCRTARSGSRAA